MRARHRSIASILTVILVLATSGASYLLTTKGGSFESLGFVLQRLSSPVSFFGSAPAAATTGSEQNLYFGNPSRASTAPDNYLLQTPFFTASYNNSRGQPNWVSWRLVAADVGAAPRYDFYPTTLLPPLFKVVLPDDYTGSGFDRGHACNHEDRSATDAASYSTFDMTNIFPQAAELNRGPWVDLESYCRRVARAGYILHIITGGVGEGGIGYRGARRSFGPFARRVTVPAYFWKVVLILDKTDTLNVKSRMLAVLVPNSKTSTQTWTSYLTTPREIERITGYTFFADLPSNQRPRLAELASKPFTP